MAKKDPSRTVSIHGDKYTYDPDKNKWMSGKKEATPATSAMLDMVLNQLNPAEDQEVETFVGTANIVPGGGEEQEKTPEQIESEENAQERREEAQDNMEESPPATEAEKEKFENVKPAPISERELTLPKPELSADESPIREAPRSEIPQTRAQKLKKEFDQNFSRRLAKEQPWLRLFTDKLDPGSKNDRNVLSDVGANIREMLGDYKNWFKETRESIAQRQSSDKLTDLTPEELTRLEKTGITSSFEQDFVAEERDAQPEPFYKRRAKQLMGEFKENFRSRLAKEHPWLRLFTDKLDDPQSMGDATPAGGVSSDGGMTAIVAPLQSIDKNIQQIVNILSADERDEAADETDAKKQMFEDKKEAALDEQVAESMSGGEAELVSEEDDSSAYRLGRKTRSGINKAKESFSKAKKLLDMGKGSASETAAAEGAEGAAIAEEVAASAEGAGLAEAAAGAAGAAGGAAAAAEGGGMLAGLVRMLPMLLALKDGGVVNKMMPFTALADGGVVDKPTAFTHEGGAGIMGEAGPEAVMPLERGLDGKLGVKVSDVEKPAITEQTKLLEQGESERQRRAAAQQSSGQQGTTIINNTNNSSGGGSSPGGAVVSTAGARNSLDLNYYAQ